MIKQIFKSLVWFLVLAALSACNLPSPTATGTPLNTSVPASPAPTRQISPLPTRDISNLPSFASLPEGWSQIDPGGDTTCARGGKYSFFVRKTKSDKLLLYFEGGGSCYDANTCRVGGNYFDDSIDPNVQADNPALKTTGVFALDDARNPFQNYNMVFVSYCTGDAFLGNRNVNYQQGVNTFTVNHQGFTNTRAVLDWTYQNFRAPGSLFMIGCSAGVVGSYFHSPYILEKYHGIPTTLVGDSGAGYLDGPAEYFKSFGTLDVLPNWLPGYDHLVSGSVVRTKYFFTVPAQAYPNTTFGLVDTMQDSAQGEILSRFNPKQTLAQVLKINLTDIQKEVPGFKYYLAPGDNHCITMQPAFYEDSVRGTPLYEWFSRLATGQPVENIAP